MGCHVDELMGSGIGQCWMMDGGGRAWENLSENRSKRYKKIDKTNLRAMKQQWRNKWKLIQRNNLKRGGHGSWLQECVALSQEESSIVMDCWPESWETNLIIAILSRCNIDPHGPGPCWCWQMTQHWVIPIQVLNYCGHSHAEDHWTHNIVTGWNDRDAERRIELKHIGLGMETRRSRTDQWRYSGAVMITAWKATEKMKRARKVWLSESRDLLERTHLLIRVFPYLLWLQMSRCFI